ncbi:cytochrome P450 3A8-like isoform X1 [Hydractinia symbiolongicarpus]|uniref:cytochrome P450 3A8-like isoform X1 n=1 Tax=Hydractinia symbiolongicarpus TaxID=13093 RepID=UPI00254CB3DF|nr:cytochrome P450 3A8-like isoform X1 [Hydractinia symbiolongicarpus]
MAFDAATYILIAIPIVLYILYWLAYGRFKSTKYVGPGIVPFLGNYWDLRQSGFNLHTLLEFYYKKYGKVYDFHYQGEPVTVVGEESIAKEILGKKFQHFQNRKFFIDLPWPCDNMITLLKDDKWKYVRALLTPFFTPHSLQNMSPLINKAVDTYLEKLDEVEKKKESFDVVSHSKGFIMETLLSIVFTLDCPNQSDFNKTLINLTKEFTQPPKWVNTVAALPFGQHLVKYIPSAFKNQLQPFIDTALGVVAGRRKEEGGKYKDVLEALFNVQKEGPDTSGNVLLDEDILAQGIVILTAVHVATSSTLAMAMYYIAKHKQVQEKIYEDIGALAGEEGFPTWENVNREMMYLEHVIDETLRLHPSAYILMRECNETCKIEAMTFEKGSNIFIPVRAMHYDATYWEDPQTFNPDRFSDPTVKKGSAYLPFGAGLRKCLGFRMAIIALKLALARILQRYEITLKDDKNITTSSDFTVQATSSIDEPIMLQLKQRST